MKNLLFLLSVFVFGCSPIMELPIYNTAPITLSTGVDVVPVDVYAFWYSERGLANQFVVVVEFTNNTGTVYNKALVSYTVGGEKLTTTKSRYIPDGATKRIFFPYVFEERIYHNSQFPTTVNLTLF
jgi:hypothetical protein